MAESDVFDEEKLFATFLQRGKAFGLQETDLMDYVDKQIRQAQERQDRLIVRREEEANRKQLELAAIKEREETARQTAKEETARQKEQEETKRQAHAEEEETKRQAQAHSQASTQDGSDGPGQASRVGHRPTLPKLPAFRDKTDDIDSYLFRFETHATALKWDKTHWVTYLSALLEGTALTLFHSLSDTEDGTVTYEQLKSALLKKFQCTPEGFRKRFRESKPTAGEPFETYAVELRRFADRWISLSKVEKTYEGLLGLILSEQLLQSVSHDLATFLCEKDERSFQNLIKSAESYRHAHPNKNLARRSEATVFGSVASVRDEHRPSEHFGPTNSFRGHGGYQSGPSHFWNRRGFDSTRRSRGDGRFRGQATRKEIVKGRSGNQSSTTKCCFLCKQPGHFHQACPWKSRKNPCRICNFSHPPDQCPFHKTVMKESTACALAPPSIRPEVACSLQEPFSGRLHLQSGTVNGVRCSVLRDTGATVCGVRKRLVRPCQLLGSSIRCVSFGGREEEFPLAKVSVDSPYFSGEITCCVLDAPVADFIVGNVPQVPPLVSQDESCYFAAVTRARSKVVLDKKPLSQVIQDLEVTPDILSDMQRKDESLLSSFQAAEKGEVRSAGGTSSYFYLSEGILYRSFTKGSLSISQVVVPKGLRSAVLAVSHDAILAGHSGSRRTLARLRSNFFWPGVTVDVSQYVKSCDVCQKTTPKGKVFPVPLGSMPLISTPFHRVAIDLVGPLSPLSSQGHRYILTIIDVATRYPEAVPLKDISAVSVAEALLTIFSRMGFPKEILSDQGSQFNSDLMKQFHALCQCRGIRTSPYHPQANGTVERFHGTLKAMLKKVVRNHPSEWHRYLPALLFACREVPSESTGFSPFHLLFGREVRGPLMLLKDTWTNKDQSDAEAKPLYPYLFELKNILAESGELAMQNSSAASQRNKKYYDKKTQDRKFSVGEEVLVLLPSASNKLLSSWLGPFPITRVFHPDYRVLVKGKEKVFHANMLKRYVRREEAADVAVGGSKCVQSVGDFVPWREISPLLDEVDISVPKVPSTSSGDFHAVESVCSAGVVQDHGEDVSIPTLSVPMSTSIPDEDVSCVQFDDALSEVQLDELKAVFQTHADILTTRPGVFSGNLMLEIPLTSDVPIRRKMYNLPFSSKEVVEKEIQVMLDLEIIEPSKSPYSSPVVLVRKKDGSCRFCIDFRGLNKITVFDAEPIPNVEDLFVRLAHSRFFTKIDLAKGYWQILVLPEDRPKTAFATHQGLFQFIRMPFGLVSAPAVFARMMRMLRLADLSAENFFDDILVHSASWSDHLHHVRNVLDRLKSYGLTARPSKILAGFQSLEFLGHVVGSGVLRPDESKTEKILQVSTPTTKKQVRSLLGLLSFYRRYIPGFASVAAPLTDLTKESGRSCRSIHWTPDCASALQEIQDILSRKPVLLLPRLNLPFVLQTDASSTGLGAVLLQEFEDSLHPVCFASRKLLDREKRYSTIERECLAIVWAVHKFVRFLWGVRFVLQTDHRPLTYLRTSNFKNSRIMRWALSLQEFSFEVLPVSGQANVFADLLSRSAVDQAIP